MIVDDDDDDDTDATSGFGGSNDDNVTKSKIEKDGTEESLSLVFFSLLFRFFFVIVL